MTKLIINCETNEITERELTAAELKQQEKDEKMVETRLAEIETKAQAKAELLQRLGITADEAKLLLA
jgi:hypothetical protein